jgi:hypothetical protein
MAEEEKGFVVKDRRAFDDEGHIKEQEEPSGKKPETLGGKATVSAERTNRSSTPLPEVNFTTLVFSLSSSALLHLGEMPDPQSGSNVKDLALAKHAIDTIAMLKDKTKGNLNEEEQKFTETVLTDLRLRYVKSTK